MYHKQKGAWWHLRSKNEVPSAGQIALFKFNDHVVHVAYVEEIDEDGGVIFSSKPGYIAKVILRHREEDIKNIYKFNQIECFKK